ncbi:hypothetical protein PFTANZ_02784 [Plasmodium falciparum Tanzania (2000708)]|uniref:U3 small nucleolar RNA-associated protein 25 n=1 Tax=Plasmodium falciparum Tanzania (2000708) TaxID=1036725 RepID=A0A024W8M1_PLAFA|nr:hypothetical protein PFTANZ_02784 [Plasmodium falciparum Tanzania (2000708)]
MGKRNFRGKKRATTLNELYELEFVKKEKKKLRKLNFVTNKNKPNDESIIKDTKHKEFNKKENKINKILLKEYEKLKKEEEKPKGNPYYTSDHDEDQTDLENKNDQNKKLTNKQSNYETFLNILQKKKKEIFNHSLNEDIKSNHNDHHIISKKINKQNQTTTKDNIQQNDNVKKGLLKKTNDEIYMSFLVNNINKQSNDFNLLNDIYLNNSHDIHNNNNTTSINHKNVNTHTQNIHNINKEEHDKNIPDRNYLNENIMNSNNIHTNNNKNCHNLSENDMNGNHFDANNNLNSHNLSENIMNGNNFDTNNSQNNLLYNYSKTYNCISIYDNYKNDSYKLCENKMDYYFSFCQNIDEAFMEQFWNNKKNRLRNTNEQKDNDKSNEYKNKTIEDIYVKSNLFLETNIFKSKKQIKNEYTGQIFNNVQIKPYFFSPYLEKNYITYYVMNILDTKPKSILDNENFYNINDNIIFHLKNYLSTFKHPVAYFNSDIYKYMQNYYNMKITKIVKDENKKDSCDDEDVTDSYMINNVQNDESIEISKTNKTKKTKKKIINHNNNNNNNNNNNGNVHKHKKKKKKIFRDISKIIEHVELKSYFHYINSYVDILYTNKNVLNSHLINLLNVVHILNHLKKKRKRRKYIKKKLEKMEKSQNVQQENIELKEEFCDESFARPKILILCPFRYNAKEYVDLICNLIKPSETKNKNRFVLEYDIAINERKHMKEIYTKKRRTLDYINIYQGNNDDCFRLGIKILEGDKKIHLYSPFCDSDILICSPLGLDIIIKESKENDSSQEQNEGEDNMIYDENSSDDYDMNNENNNLTNDMRKDKNIKKKKKNKHYNNNNNNNNNNKKKLYEYDFLSSIEILLIDQIDIILMQNLLTLKNVLKFINKPLLRWGSANINRIPKYVINGFLKNYRQTIISSSIIDTNFISLIHSSINYRSFLKLFIKNDDKSILLDLRNSLNINQYFKKIECDNILNIEESILNFFSTNVMDILTNIKQLIIFIPTYIEYLRIHELLKKNDISFKGVNEYTNEKKILQIRKLFKYKRINILLVTGRLIYYERCTFKGANHIIFFSPPKFVFMYSELIKNLSKDPNSSSICYYTKYHTYELERIVGQARTKQLIQEKNGKITLFK